jgi:hypothetical protein
MKEPRSQPAKPPRSAIQPGAPPGRFRTLYGKPRRLTDRYDECRPATIERVLGKPEAELGWDDFNVLYRVGVAPATYEEGLYFLPDAFAFLWRNPHNAAVHCVADVMWFLSDHATRLQHDALLAWCHDQVQALLRERTAQFVIREGPCRPYVQDSGLVIDMLEALLRFDTLASWSVEFIRTLAAAENEPLKSAWYLECVAESRRWVLVQDRRTSAGPPQTVVQMEAALPSLHGLWDEFNRRGLVRDRPAELTPDRALLKHHADAVRQSAELFDGYGAFWARQFRRLDIADEPPPKGTPAG